MKPSSILTTSLFSLLVLAAGACGVSDARVMTTSEGAGDETEADSDADSADVTDGTGGQVNDSGDDQDETGVDSTDTDDGGGSTTSGTGGATTGAGEVHPACDAPLPDVLPSLPQVNMSGDRPAFADWEFLDCEAVAQTQSFCNGPNDPPCDGACLADGPNSRGICTFFDVDLWCDGEGEAVGYGDGACWMCAPEAAKANACCNDLPGFDCRIWPYEFNGRPGDICARHENCEPGLVCKSGGSGYGICMCPSPDAPEEVGDQCFSW